MTFESLHHAAAKQQLKVLGGVPATLQKKTETISSVWALVENNVAVPSDNGLSMENRTVVSLLVAEVSSVERGNRIVMGSKSYTVNDVMEDDGFVVKVFVRG